MDTSQSSQFSRPTPPPDIHKVWDRVSGTIQLQASKSKFDNYIKPLEPISLADGVFTVGLANVFAAQKVEAEFQSTIERVMAGELGQPVKLKVIVTELAAGPRPVTVGAKKNGKSKPPAQSAAVELPGISGDVYPEVDEVVDEREPGEDTKTKDESKKKSARKVALERAYGSERAAVIKPERAAIVTQYFLEKWSKVLGPSATLIILACRGMCFWNPMNGEKRNTIEITIPEIAKRTAVQDRTVKTVLANPLVRKYFLRYKVRRVMTPNGIRTAGIILHVRMDDPLTPEDQEAYNLPEETPWYNEQFEMVQLNEKDEDDDEE